MSSGRRRPTLAEVAEVAGVSVMTASYAYSKPSRVSAESAAKVHDAAARLGYPGPHPGARSLRRGRAGSLGVVIGERLSYAFEDPQAARFLAGVAEVCMAAGVGLTLVPTTGNDADVARVGEAAVDGFVVWTTTEDDPVLDAVVATGLPAVIHAGPGRAGLPAVGIDDRSAARAIGRLAFSGARHPAILSFPVDRHRHRRLLAGAAGSEVTFPVTRARWEGFVDAWRERGGDPRQLRVAVCSHNNAAEGEKLARDLLSTDPAPDALAAMSDELAFGALRAAEAAGLVVPDDLAVTGWDDTEAALAAGLTTVAQSLRDQGSHCAQLALGQAQVSPAPSARPGWKIISRCTTRHG